MPCVFAQENSQTPSVPLNEPEKRLIVEQLVQCTSIAQQLAEYQKFVETNKDQIENMKVSYEQALQVEKRMTALAEKERDLAQKERDLALEQANFYREAYRLVTKKPGIGCRIARILTLGIVRCN